MQIHRSSRPILTIDIATDIGSNCITFDDGEKIFEMIHPYLLEQQVVELNFKNVKIFASPFFNAAIGPLLNDLTTEQLNEYLVFSNLSDHGNNVLRRVITNAKNFYQNPKISESVKRIIEHQAEDA